MTSIITRRSILGGLISAMAAPAIVRAASLMSVRSIAVIAGDWLTWELDRLPQLTCWHIQWGHAALLGIMGPDGLVFREIEPREFYLDA